MIISRFPRLSFLLNDTTPSISAITAWSDGLRASNNSVTRGRPPVMSPAFAEERGILARISPALISSPSSIAR